MRVGSQDARIIDRRYGEIQGAARAGVGGVRNLWHSTVIVGVRREGVVAIGANGQRPDADDRRSLACGETAGHAGNGEAGDAERYVGIAVVVQDIARGDAVFGQSASIRGQYARYVEGRDVLVAGSERNGGRRAIRTVGRETDGRVDASRRGIEHDEAVTTTGGTTSTGSSRAGSGGFKVFCRVSTGSNGLLQFLYRRRGLCSSCYQISTGVRTVRTPLRVAAQIKGAAIGQFQRHGTGKASIDLVTGKQFVSFHEYTTDALWGHHENLTNNAFDDGNNTAH